MDSSLFITDAEAAELQHCTFPGGYSPHATRGDCEFDARAAALAVNTGPRFFKHVKGEKGGRPFTLEQWQKNLIGTAFGWKRPDGTRRYRSVYAEIPRKNGKTATAMVVVGILLYIDDEPGAEIVSAASTRDQAHEVLDPFKFNVQSGPLAKISRCYLNSVTRLHPRTGLPVGVYKAVSAEAGGIHGGNHSGVIFDELHVQTNRDLWDVLETGKIARRQPLTVAITTAGHDRESICWEQHAYAEQVRDGMIDDPTYLPVIYAAAPDDDWTDPAVWRKANPNLGVSITEEALAEKCERAKAVPGFVNTFKRLHLNIWTTTDVRAVNMEAWDDSDPDAKSDPVATWKRRIEDWKGRTCCGGLDIASKSDLNAFVLVFEPDADGCYDVLPWFWVPEAAAERRKQGTKDPSIYHKWANQGLLTLCDGERMDPELLRKHVGWAHESYRLRTVAYDPWNADTLRMQLEADGVEMLEYAQNLRNFNEPTKDFLTLVAERKIRHGHHPILRWMANNLSIYEDASGNVRPDKKKSGDKIDGVVSLVMGLDCVMAKGDGPSVYETRGILEIV